MELGHRWEEVVVGGSLSGLSSWFARVLVTLVWRSDCLASPCDAYLCIFFFLDRFNFIVIGPVCPPCGRRAPWRPGNNQRLASRAEGGITRVSWLSAVKVRDHIWPAIIPEGSALPRQGLILDCETCQAGTLHRVEASTATTNPHDGSVVGPLAPSFIAYLNRPQLLCPALHAWVPIPEVQCSHPTSPRISGLQIFFPRFKFFKFN